MSKLSRTALIVTGVVALSLMAAWLFGGSESRPAPDRIAASQIAPTLPAPVSLTPLTARKPVTAPEPRPPDPTDKSLAWLAKAQHPDGHWDLSPGRTGLALIAFLSAGESHKRGKHKRTIRNGLRFLKQIQHPDGFYAVKDQARNNLSHAIATLAMVEAYAITASPLFKQSAQQGIEAIPPRGELDNLTSYWADMVIWTASESGLRVRREDLAGIELSRFGLWRPNTMKDPASHYRGCWYAASIKPDLDRTWRRDFRELAAGLQQADGSFERMGRHRRFLGRVGTTALMTAATAMTFWSEPTRKR